jgi:hypothetical protein
MSNRILLDLRNPKDAELIRLAKEITSLEKERDKWQSEVKGLKLQYSSAMQDRQDKINQVDEQWKQIMKDQKRFNEIRYIVKQDNISDADKLKSINSILNKPRIGNDNDKKE